MIPHNLEHNIEDTKHNDAGWIFIIKIKINTEVFVLCNIYAPTRDNKTLQIKFIKELKNYLTQYEHHNIIIGGDFNIYLNSNMDKSDKMSNKNDNPVSRARNLVYAGRLRP